MDLTCIEVMPVGEIEAHCNDQYLPLTAVMARIAEHYTLCNLDCNSGGHARAISR
jgi:GTP 3',8-cyclase